MFRGVDVALESCLLGPFLLCGHARMLTLRDPVRYHQSPGNDYAVMSRWPPPREVLTAHFLSVGDCLAFPCKANKYHSSAAEGVKKGTNF